MKVREHITDTRERLMDVAERLFAEAGYGNVSTRMIADEANANTAAVHYHFGSKESLLEAVFLRRLEPMNLERIARIEAEMDQGGGAPSVESILRAFIEPTLRKPKNSGEKAFRLLSGRASTDPNPEIRRVLFAAYDTVARAFAKAIAAACPHLTEEELFWRVACVYGAMMYIRADNGRLQPLFGEKLSLSDSDGALRYAIPFLTAGMSAKPISPITDKANSER